MTRWIERPTNQQALAHFGEKLAVMAYTAVGGMGKHPTQVTVGAQNDVDRFLADLQLREGIDAVECEEVEDRIVAIMQEKLDAMILNAMPPEGSA